MAAKSKTIIATSPVETIAALEERRDSALAAWPCG